MRGGLTLVLLIGCAISTELPDESGRGDPLAFCMAEMELVCGSCDPARCEAHPSVYCNALMSFPSSTGWPCDPEPTQDTVDSCVGALELDPCGDLYPPACDFLFCLGGPERP